jgi:HicA toxin of bacterial toxin-antitoxin,
MARSALSSRHRRTLASIFETPTRSDVRWQEITALLKALGADVTEGRGSRVRVALQGRKAVFHRPHRNDDTDKSALESMQRFLIEAGVAP